MVSDAAIRQLRSDLHGALLQPADGLYDSARRVWNGMIDRHPALIVRCGDAEDVVTAVHFARTQDLLVAVRGGGHNVAGNAVCDGGMVIDLSPMKAVHVDATRRTARAQAGLTWGELDRATQAFGLATTGGEVSSTGIAGLTLGGGLGWLMGKHGLTCDNLLAVDVVTADGRRLTANRNENPDLFWGVRGGGGNFGIVTSFEYQLHPVGTVLGGLLLYKQRQAREFLRVFRDVTAAAPDELTSIGALLTAADGTPAVGIALCYCGPIAEGERLVAPLRRFGAPLVDQIRPLAYPELQSMLDATVPPGRLNYWKANFLRDLRDDAIDAIIEQAATIPSPYSSVLIEHVHGAVSRVGANETAVGTRTAPYSLGIYSVWTDPRETDEHVQWTRQFARVMEPFASGAVYVNYLGDEGEQRVHAAYGANYERLTALKAKYDPTNFFRLNQNIRPSVGR
jgi:FAD/FMN-containing dehydrogenase